MLLSFSEIIVVIFRNEMKDSHGLGRSISADAHEFAEKGREIIIKKKKRPKTKKKERKKTSSVARLHKTDESEAGNDRIFGGRRRGRESAAYRPKASGSECCFRIGAARQKRSPERKVTAVFGNPGANRAVRAPTRAPRRRHKRAGRHNIFGCDHTSTKAPDPIRTPQLSVLGRE